jgi:type III secretion system FlhB-like substrate exporter
VRGCDVAALDQDGAHDAGPLLGGTGTSDISDAIVAVAAALDGEVAVIDDPEIRQTDR